MQTVSIEEFYRSHTIDSHFNEREYLLLHPETVNFYQPYCSQKGIDDRHRLYFHYEQYGQKNNNRYDANFFNKFLNSDSTSKIICLKPIFGLANRLLLINSAYSFAKQFNFDGIQIYWDESPGFSKDKFHDLFDTKISESSIPYIRFISLDEYTKNIETTLCLHDYIQQNQFTLKYSYKPSKHTLFNFIIQNTFCYSSFACLEYIFPDELVSENMFLESLHAGKSLASVLDNYQLPPNTVGVHIRKGDALRIQHAYRYCGATTQNYIDLINNVIDTDTIFLSTDCELTQNKIIDSCSSKKILTTSKSFVDPTLTSNQHKNYQNDACIDFLLLTRCQKVYGTAFSTFAKTATKITKIPFIEVQSKNLYKYCHIDLPPLSLTVGIKNRYKQLKVSLMSWVVQKAIDEILIIDWDSDDIDYEELQKIDDRIRVITISDQPNYNHAQVLNVCIKNAKNNHILKMDVDYILNPYIKLNQWLDIEWENEFMAGAWNQNHLDNKIGFIEHTNGFMCIDKKHIEKIGGYNENFVGYGWEDCELYIRLQKELGLTKIIPPISPNFVPIYHNPHMDEIRTRYQAVKDREKSRQMNIEKTPYKEL